MTLKRLGKPPFLTAAEVENDSVVEILEKPYIVPAEQTKWGKERGRIVVGLDNGEIRTWTLNITTWNKLYDAFGKDELEWVGKKVKIRVAEENVSGVVRPVLYGRPYEEPQEKLA